MKRVYIAGPMRGYPKFNFPAFDEARDRGLALGYDVISPADIDRENEPDTQGMTDAQVSTPEMLERYARRDCEAIFSVDAVAVLPGWGRSKGASAEVALARWLGKPILDARTFEPLAAPETILSEAERIVYGDRNQDYGHPHDECVRIGRLWSVILGCDVPPEKVPLCMIGMKISREMNRPKRDNLVDIAGYADCLQRIRDRQQEASK